MTATGTKTREQRNSEMLTIRKARRVPLITSGRAWNFERAVAEAIHRGFEIGPDAKAAWNEQTIRPYKRKLSVRSNANPGEWRMCAIADIINGNLRPTAATAVERAGVAAKRSVTHKARALGQKHWLEAAGTRAALQMLRIDNFEALPDGLSADFIIPRADGSRVGVQVKTAVKRDGDVSLNVRRKDGEEGGCYEHLAILAVIIEEPDREAALAMMDEFDVVPEVKVAELFFFDSAADLPGKSLSPSPRQDRDDKYGDSRFVVDFDEPGRLHAMQGNVRQWIQTAPGRSRAKFWFSTGLGSANPVAAVSQIQEIKNCEALAAVLDFDRMRAPRRQNETVDICYKLPQGLGIDAEPKLLLVEDKSAVGSTEEEVMARISLKTAVDNGKGYQFQLHKSPHAEHCDVFIVFYRDVNKEQRSHVSVLSASGVYTQKSKTFCWSKTNRSEILDNKIDIREPGARTLVEAAIRTALGQ